MKKKFNPELLKEELNRFRLLNEYDFYQEKKEAPEYKDLILGDIEEADEAPDDLKPADDVDAAAGAIGDELGVDAGAEGGDAEGDAEGGDFGGEVGDTEVPEEEPMDDMPTEEPVDDSTEVDVTALVQGSEEAKNAADNATNAANQNAQALMQKLDSLEAHVASMDRIGAKIEALEKEIIKRNPTPVEKLEMRSLDSYPYSQKLTDYWADKEGVYNVMDTGKPKPKEYVLTKDDVDSSFSDADVKKSFNVKPDYEEEDMDDYEEENV
jgi:hypothetical protein